MSEPTMTENHQTEPTGADHTASEREPTGLEIAIIGMAGRFPGAPDVETFWSNLVNGVESITHFSDEELLAAGVPPSMFRHPNYVRSGRTIGPVEQFDAQFFGISPREAEVIDPQQRIFLECCWEALEDAGCDPERYAGSIGVFAGVRMSTYLANLYSHADLVGSVGEITVQVSNDKDYVAPRISYKLNLGGPSVNVQSACSTALVAVHLAAQALQAGECDMAIAGAVSARKPDMGYFAKEGDVGSHDGHVRTFDAKASGTVFGSGLGAVVLKRLSDAIADGDHIRAVILGSAVTNDGSQKVGFTAPGVDGQVRVLTGAYLTADIDPSTLSYIEAHGTGTAVGDPIEVTALTQVFRRSTEAKQFCPIGSVKTNIGHMSVAAGTASLMKTVLALEHEQIPPSLHFETPNPQIDFESSPFYVNTELAPWKRNGAPRRAGVSAFGMGGTNAHVVVEEAPPLPATDPGRPWQQLVLAARTPTALDKATENLAAHLEKHPEIALADAAYTLKLGRKLLPHRRVVLCRDRDEAIANLRELPAGRAFTGFQDARNREVAFLFSGQGSQYPNMGRGLYDTEPVYRAEVDRCCEILEPHLGLDLRTLLFPAAGQEEAAAKELEKTQITQPALFVTELALARLWMSWGVQPAAMIGHSIGEYVAAALAEVFSVEDALRLVAARGRFMGSLPAGSMLAVPLPESEVLPLLGPELSLAAANAPARVVVSGPTPAIEAFEALLVERGTPGRRLHTSHAFHSAMMEPILAPFIAEMSSITLSAPKIPFLSNLTGQWILDEQATDAGYWAQHLRGAVRFADGLATLLGESPYVLLEVGPGRTLSTLARQHPSCPKDLAVVSSLRHPNDEQSDEVFLLRTLSELWIGGARIDWNRAYEGETRRKVSLPTYPFERQSYFIERGAAGFGGPEAATKKADLGEWFYAPYWKPAPPVRLPANLAEKPAKWLFLADPSSLTTRIKQRLRELGQTVHGVTSGDFFGPNDKGEGFVMRPGLKEDEDRVLFGLTSADLAPDYILHAWNLTPSREASDRLERVEADEARAFWSPLFFAQACGKHLKDKKARLAFLSNDLHCIGGEVHHSPEKALLLGPARVIGIEYANVRSGSIDVVLPAPGSAEEAELADRIIAEVLEVGQPPVVALRGAQRLTRGYEPIRIDGVEKSELRLRDGGVYLITGGFGGLGLTFAEFLAREHGAKLALMGPSALPERSEWSGWLASHGEKDRVSERIRKVLELEKLGGEVQILTCDVADAAKVKQCIDATIERFGALHGVIHAAGIAGGGIIQLKSPEAAQRIIAPKLHGTLAIDRALQNVPVDFFLLCSSTIAIASGLGQVDYSAANSFLDAFAHARSAEGGPYTLSLNWGAWGQVGMAVSSGLVASSSAALEVSAEPPAPGEELHPVLDRALTELSEYSVYATEFSVERHWVVSEHRVAGSPTVPGVTYLEMARAAFVHHSAAFEAHGGLGVVELSEVYFMLPLMLPEQGARRARVVLEKEADGYRFTASSPAGTRPDGEVKWDLHVRGRVRASTESAPARLDLDALRAHCAEKHFEQTEFVPATTGLVLWGAHWNVLRQVWYRDAEALVELELPAEYAEEAARFVLHPSLLDVATAAASFLSEGNFLPLAYKRVRVFGAMKPKIFAHLRKPSRAVSDDLVVVDLELADEQGNVLVAIDEFTLRRASADAQSLQRSAESAQAATGAADEGAAGPAPAKPAASTPQAMQSMSDYDAILPAEGVEALRRALARHVELPQLAVSAKSLDSLIASVASVTASALEGASGVARSSAAQSKHPRPNLSTPYVEPAGAVELQLAEIWQAVLGLEQVGVNDNFFDLGGDSVIGIQVVARAAEAGLEVTPDQLFQHQTVRDLAAAVGPAKAEPGVAALSAEEVADEAAEWIELLTGARAGLPFDGAEDAEPGTVSVSLPAASSTALTASLTELYRCDTGTLTLAATAVALARWLGRDDLLLEVERAATEEGSAERYRFPLRLEIEPTAGLAELVRGVKERLRTVPRDGARFARVVTAATGEVADALRALPKPSLRFVFPDPSAAEPAAAPASEYALEIRTVIDAAGVLRLEWSYQGDRLSRSSVEAVALSAAVELERLAASQEEVGVEALSPTDFPEADLSEDDLEKVLAKLGRK